MSALRWLLLVSASVASARIFPEPVTVDSILRAHGPVRAVEEQLTGIAACFRPDNQLAGNLRG